MKEGLLYIVFIFLVLLTVSLNDTRNDQPRNDIQTCRSLISNPGIFCSLPESITTLKKIPGGQIFSDIFHGNLFESMDPDRFNIPVQALTDPKKPATFIALGQRVLLFLISNKSNEDDPHLGNK